jgi:hypothetical protein
MYPRGARVGDPLLNEAKRISKINKFGNLMIHLKTVPNNGLFVIFVSKFCIILHKINSTFLLHSMKIFIDFPYFTEILWVLSRQVSKSN